MIAEAFEIVYSDGAVVAGTTRVEFERAPSAGIQFVIVRRGDGSIRVHKGQDRYEYAGAEKPGSWTDRANYDAIKTSLRARSKLLTAQDRDPRDLRLREPRRLRGY